MELRPPNILMEPTLHRPPVVVSPRRAAHLARKVPINAVDLPMSSACHPEPPPSRPHDLIFRGKTSTSSMDAREGWHRPQAVLHVLRSDCQQIRAHPSERNASWMSARLS
jgi:hypothetical protein